MPRTRVKICGVRTIDEALIAAAAGADAVGFNFVRGSARFIEPREAWKIVGRLPPLVSSVGVFADASLDTFSDIEEECPTVYSQLSGSEDVTLVRECGPNVIKLVRFDPVTIERELARWDRVDEVDAILIELPAVQPAAAELAGHVAGVNKPVIIGGVKVETLGDIIQTVRPYAVDVVMEEWGDAAEEIERLCREVQRADASD